MTEEEIYAEFDQLGIVFEKLEHDAVFTVEESVAVHEALPAAHTKNLFLKDKQKGFWLIVLPHDRRADLKSFAVKLGAGKFSFGKADDMERLLCVTPGAVTPIAAVHAPDRSVKVVFADDFCSSKRIAVHPLRNTATIALGLEPLVDWLKTKDVPVQIEALS